MPTDTSVERLWSPLWPCQQRPISDDSVRWNLPSTAVTFIPGARDFTVHDTLIITDGRSNCGADILASSQTLQQRSNVYALAIGLSSDPGATTEITSLVSNRDPRHLFSLANFMDFQDMVQKVRNRQNVTQCQQIVSN